MPSPESPADLPKRSWLTTLKKPRGPHRGALVVSGPLATAVGDALGLGGTALWQIAKSPVMLLVVLVILAVLYYAAPNARVKGIKWVSVGSIVALVTWIVASVAFALYVANFGSYNKTYGSLGGVVVFLLWLWITNMAVLF